MELRRLYAQTFVAAGQFLPERVEEVMHAVRVSVERSEAGRNLEVEAFGVTTSANDLETDDELRFHVRTAAEHDAGNFVDDLSLSEPDPKWATPLLTSNNSVRPRTDHSTLRFQASSDPSGLDQA